MDLASWACVAWNRLGRAFSPWSSAPISPRKRPARPANYSVRAAGKPLRVVRLGRTSKIDTYLPSGWPFAAIPMHEMFLQIEEPLGDGDLVEVEVSRAVTAAASRASFRFQEKRSLTSSIKVNQVGYLTDSPVKLAYLGRWLGPSRRRPRSSRVQLAPTLPSPRHSGINWTNPRGSRRKPGCGQPPRRTPPGPPWPSRSRPISTSAAKRT